MPKTNTNLICLILLLLSVQQITLAQSNDEITVFAASSLTNVFTELSDTFEMIYDVDVILNFAGSSTLATQLNEGAIADVFASANLEQMQAVIEESLIEPTQVTIFAENELALIVPNDNPANIESIADLANNNLFLVLANPSVPIRVYTDQLLETLSSDYDETFVHDVLQNLVSEESNVRQIVARVAIGEVDAGIVYRTDITPDVAEAIQIVPLPIGASPRAQYPIAPLIDAPNSDLALKFIDFVSSDEGQAILQTWGFCSPDESIPEPMLTPEMTPEPELTPNAETIC
ncbi:MAG: molybdate ABC transporter substrate-binding protein [Chloroflexota bacterium]